MITLSTLDDPRTEEIRYLCQEAFVKRQFVIYHKTMAWCKAAVTPLPTYRSYCSLALSHRNALKYQFQSEHIAHTFILVHWSLNKRIWHSKLHFLERKIIIQFKFVWVSLDSVIFGSWSGFAPILLLIGPIITQFIDVYMRHQVAKNHIIQLVSCCLLHEDVMAWKRSSRSGQWSIPLTKGQ